MATKNKKAAKGPTKGVGKVAKVSKTKQKRTTRSNKHQIEQLNAASDDISEIHQLLGQSGAKGPAKGTALNVRELKDDFKRDTETKQKAKEAEAELNSQLDIIASMGL
ncbi:antisense of depressing factor protein 1 [Diutina catenulata]